MKLQLLEHKKFQAGFAMAIVTFLGQFFTGWSQTGDPAQALAMVDWTIVIAPVMVAIGAQGLADFGKEKAKISPDLLETDGSDSD